MFKKNLTRKHLSKKIYQSVGFSKNFSSVVIDDFFKIMIDELIKFNKMKISSFGTFKVITKNERVGRNPKTKIESRIKSRKVVTFKPSQSIKKKLNQ